MPSATDLTAYTPLESLLLFRSLAAYGVEPAIFSRISDHLKTTPTVRDASTYDAGRLSPDALRELYLRLLKEEVRDELQQQEQPSTNGEGPNGDAPSTPRKRKAPSPALPTVQEAAKHAHLIPQLVMKLYTRFREVMVRDIREEERKWDNLKRELGEIERGEWDDRIKQEIERGVWTEVIRSSDLLNGKSLDSSKSQKIPRASKDDVDKAPSVQAPSSSTSSAKESPSRPAPPSAEGSRAQSPSQSRTQSQPAPKIQHPPANQQGYPFPNLPGHQSPYAQPSQPHQAGASPIPPNATAGRSPASPLDQPHQPPAGYQGPVPTSGRVSPQQHRAGPPIPSNPYSQSSQGLQTPQAVGTPPQGAPSTPQTQTSRGVPAFPHGQSPQPQPYHPPHQGGYMLPPFQVTPQDPTRAQLQPQQSQQPSPPQNRTQPSTPVPKSAPPAGRAPVNPHISDIVKQLGLYTPVRARPPPIRIPSSSFKRSSITPRPANATPQERAPSASPISDRAPSPEFAKPRAAGRTRKKSQKASETAEEDTATRGKPGRKTRQARGVSAASSSAVASSSGARGPTRSQSVTSQPDDTMSDSENRRVKNEPDTPSALPDDVSAIEGTPTATSLRRGNGRRGQMLAPTTTGKRKRNMREESVASSGVSQSIEEQGPSATPTTPAPLHPLHEPKNFSFVKATRNFSRVCSAVMDDITSHKYASMFALPVKEKHAEGYTTMIHRPQDLKSIKAAISAGSKAVNATASSQEGTGAASPGVGTSATGSSVQVPVSLDLIPPKGIVNSGQLERELTRMFANAVMFNAGDGDEGVVHDAREMFLAVEKSVSDWRGAERMSRGLQQGALGRRGTLTAEETVETPTAEEESQKEQKEDKPEEAEEEKAPTTGRAKRRRL